MYHSVTNPELQQETIICKVSKSSIESFTKMQRDKVLAKTRRNVMYNIKGKNPIYLFVPCGESTTPMKALIFWSEKAEKQAPGYCKIRRCQGNSS